MIIGTAGHVDHGKTALVRALTGQDTDRLPEEKARGISIDLGFAEFTLPGGERAGVVDVPGHERFIRNMVAGAAGIDLVLMVVAADEGVMPQTREHLDILRLLGVEAGLVALTKKDLVDAAWLELVAGEVREALAGTFLAGAPVIPVSSVTGEGLDALKEAIERLLPAVRPRPADGHARLPVDRAFSVAGAGTVVTGTLRGGPVAADDRLELLPAGLTVRVRQVQVHGRRVERGLPGQRVALNVVGADRDQVRRGDVLAAPGSLRPARTFAARLHLLAGAPRHLENGARLHLHTGTSEVLGRALLLDRERLAPGEDAFVQFQAEAPLVAARGDRYIVRSYSPVTTIGGGVILDVARRYKRFQPAGLADLARLETGDRRDLLAAVLRDGRPLAAAAAAREAGLPWDALRPDAEALVRAGEAVWLGRREFIVAAAGYARLRERLLAFLDAFHGRYPLRDGAPREELRTVLWPDLDVRESNALLQRLEEDGVVTLDRDRVALAGHGALPPEIAAACARVEAAYRDAGLAPPAPADVARLLPAGREGAGPAEVLGWLVNRGTLVKVGEDLYFHREALAEAATRVRAYLEEHGAMTLARMRDLLGTTRRYAVPLAEHFDRVRLTRRVGDERRLTPP